MMRELRLSWTMFLLAIMLLHSVANGREARTSISVLDLSESCQPLDISVNDFDHVRVVSNEFSGMRRTPAQMVTCEANFKTTLSDKGLCVSVSHSTVLGSHARIELLTTSFGPDKIIRRQAEWEERWCTRSSLLTVRVSSNGRGLGDSFTYYDFTVTNVSRDAVPTFHYMDSFAECGLDHKMTSGKEVQLLGEREPRVATHLPQTCTISFRSTSEDEYEQVCVQLEILPSAKHKSARATPPYSGDPSQALEIEGLNSKFYSMTNALSGAVVCSENKWLRFNLNRNQTAPFNFRATVSSRWHEYWERESTEAAEIKGLVVVKNITYFIATIDSLVAIAAAALSYMLRKPKGPWRRWAENFNAHVAAHAPEAYPPQEQGTYVSHSCPDDSVGSSVSSPDISLGAYPELPGEMQAPGELHVEAHNF